jgi:hypothetical protein
LKNWNLYRKIRLLLLLFIIDLIGVIVIADAMAGVNWLPGDDLFIGLLLTMSIVGFTVLLYLLLVSGVNYYINILQDEPDQRRLRKDQSLGDRSR